MKSKIFVENVNNWFNHYDIIIIIDDLFFMKNASSRNYIFSSSFLANH